MGDCHPAALSVSPSISLSETEKSSETPSPAPWTHTCCRSSEQADRPERLHQAWWVLPSASSTHSIADSWGVLPTLLRHLGLRRYSSTKALQPASYFVRLY